MNISNAVFAGNKVLEYHSNILLFTSTMESYQLHFVRSEHLVSNLTSGDYCNVHVPANSDDLTTQSSA
jgi:hypothetical protein